MRKFAFIFFSLCLLACKRADGTFGPKINAKVVRITCATTVIQILDSSFYSLGETWVINGTTDTLEHATKVLNKCEFPSSLTEGTAFYFKQLDPSHANNTCAVC